MAKLCQLEVIKAVNGNFGCYQTPGGETKDYVGIVNGPLTMSLGPNLQINVPFVRVIQHNHPLFLLGADVMRAGSVMGQWHFTGIKAVAKVGGVDTYLTFQQPGGPEARALLVSAPFLG